MKDFVINYDADVRDDEGTKASVNDYVLDNIYAKFENQEAFAKFFRVNFNSFNFNKFTIDYLLTKLSSDLLYLF